MKYAFLEDGCKLPIIIASDLTQEQKAQLLNVLREHKKAIAWKISDIRGISPSFCTHKILIESDFKAVVQPQRRLNSNMKEVVKAEVLMLLDVRMIYPILDSPWVSPVQVVPKKGGMTVVPNEKNELVPTRTVTGWRRCMMAIFYEMVEDIMEIFIDDFSVFGDSFSHCLKNLSRVLQRCEETNLVLNWEKCYFMVQEGIVLGHKISYKGIQVDKAKIDTIKKLPLVTSVKAV
ncbi:uncharacterized protein LOC113855024 [Abrus precatorius]|uniref:Uncharacterized protein LOC113855024 n=1 Tax=Abrus precatorius TaxID=3816 RepID=A0A8B8KEN6_ABRPR|nr:uncharacterized protein LOC113855024 [Abrus precatorius]